MQTKTIAAVEHFLDISTSPSYMLSGRELVQRWTKRDVTDTSRCDRYGRFEVMRRTITQRAGDGEGRKLCASAHNSHGREELEVEPAKNDAAFQTGRSNRAIAPEDHRDDLELAEG